MAAVKTKAKTKTKKDNGVKFKVKSKAKPKVTRVKAKAVMPLLKSEIKTKLDIKTKVIVIVLMLIAVSSFPFFAYQVLNAVTYFFDLNNLQYTTVGSEGLMSYYSFESSTQASPGVFIDAVNPANKATIVGDVLLQNKELPGTGVTRIKGDRLNFWGQPFGTDKQYLSLPLTFPNTANISVSFWFKPNTQFINVTTDQTIIKRTSVFEIMIVGAASSTEKENLKVKVFNKATGQYDTVNQFYFGNSTDWKQITWTYNGAGVAPYYSNVYVNGVLTNSKTFTAAKPLNAQPNDATQTFTISNLPAARNNLTAQFDELKIYDRAISQARITANNSGLNCQQAGLDPYTVAGLDYCGSKSETYQERLACLRQSCRKKYDAVMSESDPDFFATADNYCANPLRVTPDSTAYALDVAAYCLAPKTATSTNCLTVLGRDFTAFDSQVQTVCNDFYPNNVTSAYGCYIDAKYGTYHLTNSVANCGKITDTASIQDCMYYLSRSDPAGTLYSGRADQIVKLFGYQSSTMYYNAPTFATQAAAQQYVKSGSVTAKSSGSPDDFRDLLKDIFLGGKCLTSVNMGIMQHGFASAYYVVRMGWLGDCYAICSDSGTDGSPLIGQACSSLYAQNTPVDKIHLDVRSQAMKVKYQTYVYSYPLKDPYVALTYCDLGNTACGSGQTACAMNHPACQKPVCEDQPCGSCDPAALRQSIINMEGKHGSTGLSNPDCDSGPLPSSGDPNNLYICYGHQLGPTGQTYSPASNEQCAGHPGYWDCNTLLDKDIQAAEDRANLNCPNTVTRGKLPCPGQEALIYAYYQAGNNVSKFPSMLAAFCTCDWDKVIYEASHDNQGKPLTNGIRHMDNFLIPYPPIGPATCNSVIATN